MKFKKIFLALLVSVLMLTNCVSGVVAASYNHLNAVGITDDILTHKESLDLITRGEFACLVSKLIVSDSPWPSDTGFSDVTKEHAYSGEIKLLSDHGIINGVGRGLFNPEGNISIADGIKITLRVLGYGEMATFGGEHPVSYERLGSTLGLYKDLKGSGGMLTKEDAFKLLYNTLLACDGMGEVTVFEDGNFIYGIDEDAIFLTTRLGFSVYRGEITGSDRFSSKIEFRVKKNEFESNRVVKNEGEMVTFKTSGGIDVCSYEHVPVLIWVDSNDRVVYVDLPAGYEILYGYVDSVNRDSSENSAYQIDELNYITLQDNPKEYRISDNAEVWHNGTKPTIDVTLCGTFSKLVVNDGEAVSICSWDMTVGGLITEVDTTNGIITYIQAEVGIRKIKELKDPDFLSVNIDGRNAEFKEIKPNSVFSYYRSEDAVVIAISERTAIGVLGSISDKSIKIDTLSYARKNCYFSVDGVDYIKDDYSGLFGKEVCVFFGPDKYAMFVRAEKHIDQTPDFYGAVVGIKSGGVFEENSQIMLWVLGEKTYKDIYVLTKKTKYLDGLSVDVLKNNACKLDGSGIYYFTADENKNIKQVKRCNAFSGYGDTVETTLTSFETGSIPYVVIGEKVLYFTGSPIVGLYEGEGGFAAKNVQWSNFAGLTVRNAVKLRFYSEKETPYPELVLLMDNLSGIRNRATNLGFVTEKVTALNEDGDIVNRVTFLTGKGNKEYELSDELANQLYEGAFVSYYDGKAFSEDEIELRNVYDLSGPVDSWGTDATNTYGLQKGVVRKIDEARLYVKDANGEAIWFTHPSLSYCFSVQAGTAGNLFKQAMRDDIGIGDTVFYYILSGDIRVIITIE